jgi:hypothetical protein
LRDCFIIIRLKELVSSKQKNTQKSKFTDTEFDKNGRR